MLAPGYVPGELAGRWKAGDEARIGSGGLEGDVTTTEGCTITRAAGGGGGARSVASFCRQACDGHTGVAAQPTAMACRLPGAGVGQTAHGSDARPH